jgi:cell division protein FtsB
MARSFRPGERYVVKVPGTGRLWQGLLLGLGLSLILALLLTGKKSIFTVISLYREQESLAEQIAELKTENEKLTQQIEDLKTNSKAVERIAREELGMVRGDETVYRFVSPEVANKAGK